MKRNVRKSSHRKFHSHPGSSAIGRPLISRVLSSHALNSFGVLVALLCLLALLVVTTTLGTTARAASPTSGTLTTTSADITWRGTASGGAAVGDPALGLITSEEMCIEGTTCETFTLTIGGTPADWANAVTPTLKR